MAKEKQWFPLESNPTLLNSYISNLGFSTSKYHFVDVFSTDEWALEMIQQPVVAVVVLFPMNDKIVQRRREVHKGGASNPTDNDVWYVKQRIRNACGTIAILHALANIPQTTQSSEITPSSWIQNFLAKCPHTMSPSYKATILENDDTLEQYHEAATNDASNQTNRPELDDAVDMHFATFSRINEKLYELDGRLEGPVCHGTTSGECFLRDACGVVMEWMKADPTEVRFTILAMAPSAGDKCT